MKRNSRKGFLQRVRLAGFFLSVLLAGALLAYGISRGEVGEVMFNAAML